MKFIPQFAIKRPASMIVLMVAILIMGYMNFSRLPVDLLPDMDLPIAAIIATYQGAAPEAVEDQVTKVLESAVGTVGGIDTLTSVSSSNSSIVITQFKYGTNMDDAMMSIRDNVSRVESALPDGVKPMIIKFDPNMIPIIQFTLGGDYTLAELQSIVEDKFESRISRIPEVASVTITGGREREITIDIDPVKAANYGLSLSQIATFLQQENYNLSSGNLSYGERKYIVRGLQRFESLQDIENVALTTSTGNRIFLKDVAVVESSYKETTQITRVDGEYAVGIHCQKEADSNTVTACNAVKAEIDKILAENNLDDLEVNIVLDQSDYIKRSINSTGRMMLEGGILAVLIILFFLRNLSSTLIVAISIPMSIVATFIVMYYSGSTVNMITLGGLALGIGRIVDDSIVVFENIYRHRADLGESAFEAALNGTVEVGGAVIACTLTLMAVFIPIGLTEGIAGIMFKPLATTIAVAIFCSLVVSLTIVPFLASRILTDQAMAKSELGSGWVRRRVDGLGSFLANLDNAYQRLIRWALGHRKIVIAATTLLMVAALAMTPMVGAEFMPASDAGTVAVTIEADKGTSITDMEQLTILAENELMQHPLVETVFVSIGSTGMMSMNSSVNVATISVTLINLTERRGHSSTQVADELGKALSDKISGVKISASASSGMGGMSSGSSINISIRGDDLATLRNIAQDVEDVVKQVPGTREVSSSLSDGDPEVQVRINRQRAADFGFTPRQISNEVRNAIDGMVVSKYQEEGKEIDIRLINRQGAAKDMDTLTGLKILTSAGVGVPLSDLAVFELTRGPVSISRINQVRQASISGDILNRDLNSVMTDIRTQLDIMPLPAGYEIVYTGQNQQMMESFSSLLMALLLAIMLVYVVLVILYESFFDPFVIFFSIPTAFVGVVLSLVITGRTFSVNSFIGVIMLVGIVVANAILFIDYLKQQRAKGMERNEAIILTGGTRLRPILMVSFCTMLAMLPMATGLAEGSELNSPLATVVIGGLLVSTFVTLILVPVVYSIFDDIGEKFKARRERKRQEKESRQQKADNVTDSMVDA